MRLRWREAEFAADAREALAHAFQADAAARARRQAAAIVVHAQARVRRVDMRLDRDFARAPTITYNAPGERARDVWDAYPCAILAEFAMPETDERPAESLLLVFERYRGAWYLRGVVHAGWTI